MKYILCYGDSNTHGATATVPIFERFDYEQRWPGKMQQLLGNEYRVYEEGCGGRTTMFDDPIKAHCRNGRTTLLTAIASHKPIDLIILMLGTNDCKKHFGASPGVITMGNRLLIQDIRGHGQLLNRKSVEILLVSPVCIGEHLMEGPFGEMFGPEAIEKSKGMAPRFEKLAAEESCHFLNADLYASVGPDHLHINAEGHQALASVMAEKAKEILG